MTRHNAQTRTGPPPVHPAPAPLTLRRTLLAAILAALAGTGLTLQLAHADGGASLAYQNPFLYPVEDEWSPVRESVSPNGEMYLGHYTNQTVTLTLGDLPEHEYMVIAFDLYAIGDWPGDKGPDGKPTAFNVTIDGVESLMNASIATDNGDATRTQSFPDDMGKKMNFAECGIFRNNSLGFVEPDSKKPGDATYRVILACRHSGTNVRIEFTASGLGAPEVASWGLDNVAVEVSSGQLYPDMSVVGPTEIESYFNEFFSGGNPGSNPPRNDSLPPPSSVDDPGDPTNPTGDPPPPPPVPAPGTALGVGMLGATLLRRKRREA